MVDKLNPMSGKVVPGQQPKPQQPKSPNNPISGKVVPNKPNTKPEPPKTPMSGKVLPKKKFALVTAALALVTLGFGTALYYKFKGNNTESKK